MPVADTEEVARITGPSPLAAAALDLHKGIDTRRASRCDRWPEGLFLESTLGELVPGRCRAVNLCDYCARLAAVETAEVLALDALNNSAPRTWSVLTTRTASMEMRAFQRGRHEVRRAVKREWPDATAATMVEFQTGRGKRAGGERRPHWNDMWKGVPPEDADKLGEVLASAWCQHVDAEPGGQFAGTVSEMGGLMRYLALHFQKQDQQPPEGFRGHRFRAMKGYLDRPMAQAREEARASLRFKRELWRAHQAGLDGEAAEWVAQRAFYERSELAWMLVRRVALPTAYDAEGMPCAWTESTFPVVRA